MCVTHTAGCVSTAVSSLHALRTNAPAADGSRDVGCPLVDLFEHCPGTSQSRSCRTQRPPASCNVLAPQLQRLLVHRHMLSGHVPLSPPGASIWPSTASLTPAEAPVGAMGLSQLAAAVLTAPHIALLEPGAIGDVRELVDL